jgi:PBP1b-binding outer membrane lipoprotein LpoB
MTSRGPLQQVFGLTLIALLLTGCSGALAEPTATPTAVPTPTPSPTPTPVPFVVGDWVEGHFWSIKVVEVKTETELDGEHPMEDVFVLVNVQWKANGLEERHIISGMDFQLVDDAGA